MTPEQNLEKLRERLHKYNMEWWESEGKFLFYLEGGIIKLTRFM